MRVLATAAVLLGSTVAAQEYVRGTRKLSPMVGSDLATRSNLDECKAIPAPFSCEQSCGPSYSPCVFDMLCYNPDAGESCCSDGSFCPEGTYCTDEGCCANGLSLEECGASTSVGVIPPGEIQATGSPSLITHSAFEPETSATGTSATQTGSSETQTATPSGNQTATSGNQTATSETVPSETDTRTSEAQTETSTGTAPIGSSPPLSGSAPTSSGSIPTSTAGNSTVTTAEPSIQPTDEPIDSAAVPLKGAAGALVLGWIGVMMALL